MLKKNLLLVVICSVLSSAVGAGKIVNTRTGIVAKMQTFLLAGTLLICSACGPLSDSSFMHRQRLGDARRTATMVLDLQQTNKSLAEHVLAQDHNGRYVIGEIIGREDGDRIHIRPYNQKRLVTVGQQEILGQLIDNHRHVGLEITLPSEEVGIEHFVGQIFAVYDSDIYAIKISHKLDFSGSNHKLEYEDGNVLRFIHYRNIVISDESLQLP